MAISQLSCFVHSCFSVLRWWTKRLFCFRGVWTKVFTALILLVHRLVSLSFWTTMLDTFFDLLWILRLQVLLIILRVMYIHLIITVHYCMSSKYLTRWLLIFSLELRSFSLSAPSFPASHVKSIFGGLLVDLTFLLEWFIEPAVIIDITDLWLFCNL